ncbi:MAG: hypothetical protein V4759_05690 [Pseudomonadota bacterium]
MSVPKGGLVLQALPDGQVSGRMTLHVSYDVYPQWLLISLNHARDCEKAASKVDAIWTDGEHPAETEALEAELRAGMQACVAAAAALDGFYGTVQHLAPPSLAMVATWKEKRTARFAQMAEMFRLATKVGPKSFAGMRAQIKTLLMFRDEAVHPTGASREPILHPRLPVAVERRLAMYSSENAINAATSALSIIGALLTLPKDKHPKLCEHLQIARDWVDPIATAWEDERRLQPLYPREKRGQYP